MHPSLRKSAPRGTELVDLLAECHGRIRHFTALACEIAARTEAPSEQIVQACQDVRRYLSEALPLHVADENDSVAPRLRGLAAEVDDALMTMEREHQQHVPRLSALVELLEGVRETPLDLTRRAALGPVARAVADELEAHLVLEERMIFPAVGRLARDVQAEIVSELRARRSGFTLPT